MTVTTVGDLDPPVLWDRGMGAFDLDAVRALPEEQWLAKTRLGYVVTRYDDVYSMLRDRRLYSASSRRPDVQPAESKRCPLIVEMDGEEHARVRGLVSSAFTPRAANRLRPYMRQTFEKLLEPALTEGRCEAVQDLCVPYPVPVICELLGAPKQDAPLLTHWADDINRRFYVDAQPHLEAIRQAQRELDQYARSMIEERRKNPTDDLLSDLIAIEEQGDRLSSDELVSMVQSILIAGTDTTRNQLACSIALLMTYPDQWQLLCERPELAARAAEETMRHVATLRGALRFASEDVVYRDVLFPKGTMVWTSTAMANKDPRVWEEAAKFDIALERSTQQLAFGSGVHFCLGASLARAELQEALTILAERAPGMRLNGEVVYKPESVGIWGPAVVPLQFTN